MCYSNVTKERRGKTNKTATRVLLLQFDETYSQTMIEKSRKKMSERGKKGRRWGRGKMKGIIRANLASRAPGMEETASMGSFTKSPGKTLNTRKVKKGACGHSWLGYKRHIENGGNGRKKRIKLEELC